METLRQIVYASSAVRPLRDVELVELLEGARFRNAGAGITGLLLYAGGPLIQVLEGQPPVVEKLLRRIRRDPRHRGFFILLDRVVASRDFAGHPMDFHLVSPHQLDQLAGFFSWSTTMPTRRRNSAAIHLMETFRRDG